MGDYSKAKRELGWQPKVKFEELVKIMVKADWGKVKVKTNKTAFFAFEVPIFSYSIKDQLQYPRKLYIIDTGIRNAVSFRFSLDWGKLAENLVFIELKRQDKEIYYWKNSKNLEVDFLIKEGLEIKELIVDPCLRIFS